MKSKLYIVIPCYNEETVLPITAPLFLNQLDSMQQEGLISDDSRILFVNDGSSDKTWEIIKDLHEKDSRYIGISQSRNRGHQNAVLAGLMEAKGNCDIAISIDCDGQDDISAMTKMVQEYHNGCEVVYGVRNSRDTDSFFKRTTAQGFYKFMSLMGVETVYNHADYRLVSSKVLEAFADFKEVNLFLRGLFPLVGFKSAQVFYDRNERMAGESHYPLSKMLGLASDGITSLSVKPLNSIFVIGFVVLFASFMCLLCSIILALLGKAVAGWIFASEIISFLIGVLIICLGILGMYVGKMYMEVKARPRYIISERIE